MTDPEKKLAEHLYGVRDEYTPAQQKFVAEIAAKAQAKVEPSAPSIQPGGCPICGAAVKLVPSFQKTPIPQCIGKPHTREQVEAYRQRTSK